MRKAQGAYVPGMRVPDALRRERCADAEWLAALPRLAAECAEQWQLTLEEPIETPRSLVVPAGDVVLKLNAPSHFEADHEAEALARWAARGTVRLLERDDRRRALLIERCRPGTPLLGSGGDEAAVVVDLLARSACDVGGSHPFRHVADEAERWAAELPDRFDNSGQPFDGSLLALALDVFRSTDAAATALVNQDLHCENVLAAEREPWLMIDPKPLVGEREVDSVGLLRNAVFHDGTAGVRLWLDALAEIGLDRERMRAWGCAHALAWGWSDEAGWLPRSVEVAHTIFAA